MNRATMLAAIVPFFFLPMCVVAHEVGHLAVAKAYGYGTTFLPTKAVLHYSEYPGTNRILTFLIAGPLVDVLQIGTGLALLYWLRNRDGKYEMPIYWVAMVLAFISMKWVATPLIACYIRCDEVQISTLLGGHPMILPTLVMILGIPVMAYIVIQHLKGKGTVLQLISVPLFGIMGGGLRDKVVGPMLLN